MSIELSEQEAQIAMEALLTHMTQLDDENEHDATVALFERIKKHTENTTHRTDLGSGSDE